MNARISPLSPFANSGFKAGQHRITMINDKPTPREAIEALLSAIQDEDAPKLTIVATDAYLGGKTASLIDQLRDAKKPNTIEDDETYYFTNTTTMQKAETKRGRRVSVVAKQFLVSARKGLKYETIGVGLQASSSNGTDTLSASPIVVSMSKGCIFSGSNLCIGHRIISINGLKCPTDPYEAVKMIDDIESDVWLQVAVADPLTTFKASHLLQALPVAA